MAKQLRIRNGSKTEFVYRAEEIQKEFRLLLEAIHCLYRQPELVSEHTERKAKVVIERIGWILGEDEWPF